MNELTAEFIGTGLLMLLGTGINANNTLNKAYAQSTGWVFITLGWGFAVFVGVAVAGPYSGAHINPAVSVGLAMAGKFAWAKVPGYVLAQFAGAFTGSFLAWLSYAAHYNETTDAGSILGTFSTGPAIAGKLRNLYSEVLGTFVLVFVVLYLSGASITANNLEDAKIGLGSIGALPVALLVVVIGMALGGTTGYAINPARDLSPRIVHALVPIKHKGGSNWQYAWVPVLGPVIGSMLAAVVFKAL
ncbi:MAG: aquaporin family protein [Cyclobacteriaceae bacterium]|nr:aquaporin family protein [Cyclobacteriaceae bacterium]